MSKVCKHFSFTPLKIQSSGLLSTKDFCWRSFSSLSVRWCVSSHPVYSQIPSPRPGKRSLARLGGTRICQGIFQLSPFVWKVREVFIFLEIRDSLPESRNWSTLENIWDFTTLGSHILHRGGILCPSGGDCLNCVGKLCNFKAHKALLSAIRTWVLTLFIGINIGCNERLAHGSRTSHYCLMKNNMVLRKPNEILKPPEWHPSWNIGKDFLFTPSLNKHGIRFRIEVTELEIRSGGQGRVLAIFLRQSAFSSPAWLVKVAYCISQLDWRLKTMSGWSLSCTRPISVSVSQTG